MHTIDEKDYRIFSELLRSPFQSHNSLSKKIGLARATVRDRINHMKTNGFLRADTEIHDPVLGSRVHTELIASYNPNPLGLVRINVLFRKIINRTILNKITSFCDAHPYTHYRGVSFNDSISLFAQFDVPRDIEVEMISIINEVSTIVNINLPMIFVSEKNCFATADINSWSLFKREWNLSRLGIENTDAHFLVERLWKSFFSQNSATSELLLKSTRKKEKVYTLSLLEASLLRELTINAKVSLDFLVSVYNTSKSSLSKALSRLKRNVVHRGVLLYDEAVFELNNIQIAFGKFSEHSELNPTNFENFILNEPLPFTSDLYYNDEYFVLQTFASPIISTEISKFLWLYTDPAVLKINQLHLPDTILYYFYHENYLGNGIWRVESDYIRENPLEIIKGI